MECYVYFIGFFMLWLCYAYGYVMFGSVVFGCVIL